jgi:hypothetical protein
MIVNCKPPETYMQLAYLPVTPINYVPCLRNFPKLLPAQI